MLDYILCLLGIFVYFLMKYTHRTKKEIPWSFSYWVKDNWVQVSATLALTLALMLWIHVPGTIIPFNTWLSSFLPFEVTLSVIPGISLFLGLGGSWSLYNLFKSKRK